MNQSYTVVVKRDGPRWIGWVEEVPGVNCQERTKGGLLDSLRITLAEALDLMRGRAVPYLDLRSGGIADQLCRLLRQSAPDGAYLSAGPYRSFAPERAAVTVWF